MSIFKRTGSPNYCYEFLAKGKRYRGSCGTDDRELAKTYEAKLRAQLAEEAITGKKADLTLDEAVAFYLEEVCQFQPSAYNATRNALRVTSMLDKRANLADLGQAQIAKFITRRRAMTVRNGDRLISNGSVNCETEFLRRVYKHASKAHEAAVPSIDWAALMLPEEKERKVSLGDDGLGRLLGFLRPDYHDLFLAAVASGIRLSNLINLRWSQVDPDAGVIKLRVKSRLPGGREIILPLAGELAEIIERVRGQHREYVFTYVCQRCNSPAGTGRKAGGGSQRSKIAYVGEFAKGTRRRFVRSGAWKKDFAKAREKAGLASLRFHDLRHAFGNKLYAATGNLKIVQHAMGHADPQSTLRYMHANLGDVRQALESLGKTRRARPRAVA